MILYFSDLALYNIAHPGEDHPDNDMCPNCLWTVRSDNGKKVLIWSIDHGKSYTLSRADPNFEANQDLKGMELIIK